MLQDVGWQFIITNSLMLCNKCGRESGQMLCKDCFERHKQLRCQKIDVYTRQMKQIQSQITVYSSFGKDYEQSMLRTCRKAQLLAKIRQVESRNKATKQRLMKKEQQISQFKELIILEKAQLTKVVQTRKQVNQAHKSQLLKIEELGCTKKVLLDKIIEQLNNKFGFLLKYLSMDTVQPCKLEDWKKLFTRQAEQYVSEEALSQQMNLFLELEQQAKLKIAANILRSIKAINLLACLHGVHLPFKTVKGALRISHPLLQMIYDAQQRTFNLNFLRFHQANTIYFYSRACITVHHPQVQEGRLQELHETFVNRLKGYSLSPISYEFRKPLEMLQLSSEGLGSVIEEEKARQRSQEVVIVGQEQQEEDILMKEITQYVGFKSVDSSDDEVQLLI